MRRWQPFLRLSLAAFLVLVVVATGGFGIPGAGSRSPSGAIHGSMRLEQIQQVAVLYDAGCNAAYPQRLRMFQSGVEIPDLYMCRNAYANANQVWNVSANKVWYFESPRSRYWVRSEDVRQSVRVQLFRDGLRRVFGAQGRTPNLTLEPGTGVSLRAFPFQVRLQQDPYEQAAWRAVALSVTTMEKKARYAVASVLGFRSPTRRAVLTCAVSAYNAYDRLDDSSQNLASSLATALGLRGDALKCSKAIDRAAKKAPDESVVLTSEDLTRTSLKPKWQRVATRWLERAARSPIARRF